MSGEPFDPTIHEALTAVPSPEATEPTVLEVYQPGYRFAGRVIRPARVIVAQPVSEDQADGRAHRTPLINTSRREEERR